MQAKYLFFKLKLMKKTTGSGTKGPLANHFYPYKFKHVHQMLERSTDILITFELECLAERRLTSLRHRASYVLTKPTFASVVKLTSIIVAPWLRTNCV